MSDDNVPTRGTGNPDHVPSDSERDALTTDSREFVTTDDVSGVTLR